MKKKIGAGLVLAWDLSAGAAADLTKWVVVDGRETYVIYADVATVRRSGNIARMWDMSDSKTGKVLGGVKQSQSFKMEREYDCEKQQLRMLYVSWYSGNMGEGNIIGSDSNAAIWQPVLQGTIGERLWKVACGEDRRHF